MTEPQRLALIVATKDRPPLLRRLLESVAEQSRLPDQVIVVDGGEASVEPVLAQFPQLHLQYLKMHPPSLTKQKNLGIAALGPGMSLVGFLDDDLVLEDGALAAMVGFWAQASPGLGGAAFTDVVLRPRRGVWFKRLFALDGAEDGRILRSGHNTSVRPQARGYAAQWLPGGATVWRREVVDAFRFDEWFTGYSYLEDVDYSLSVGRHYGLMVVPQARMRHESIPMGVRQQFRFGIWQVTNRFYLVRKHRQLSIGWCAWSLVGQLCLNATVGVARWGMAGVSRALGNLVGWIALAVQSTRGGQTPVRCSQ